MTDMLKEWFESIFGSSLFSAIENALTLNPSSDFTKAWTAIGNVYSTIMVPIALGLMLIWFLVAFMEKSASEQVTLEQVLMLFVKMIAAKFLIDHGFEILTNLWSLGITIVEDVSDAFESSNGATLLLQEEERNKLWKEITGYNWNDTIWNPLSALGALFQMFLPWIATKVMIACAYFICYSRLIEMLIRMLAAPIALSDFITEGLHGAGWKYLKGFLAICLQGMLIMAISEIYSLIMANVLTTSGDFWDIVLKMLAFSFSAIALMFKSLTISKELVGAS